jgi:hypothetical protein
MASNSIQWQGLTEAGSSATVVWGNNSYTWDELRLAATVAAAAQSSARARRNRQEFLQTYFDDKPEDKERFIRLICRVKGIKVYDDTKKVDTDVKIKVEDIELVLREVLKSKQFTMIAKVNNQLHSDTQEIGSWNGLYNSNR